MSKATIYHNPRCRKSRETLALLEEQHVEIDIVEYLKDTPSVDELKGIIKALNIQPEALIRKGEKVYKGNYKDKNLTAHQWVEVLTANPILIERPIVVFDGKAIIGRPPENVNSLF